MFKLKLDYDTISLIILYININVNKKFYNLRLINKLFNKAFYNHFKLTHELKNITQGYNLCSISKNIKFKVLDDVTKLKIKLFKNKITELNLSLQDEDNNNIININNKLLSQCKNLTSLDLTNNNLIYFSSIKELKHLKILDLTYNDVISSHQLSQLTKLEELNLSYNHIINTQSLENLTNLKSLNLHNNDFIQDNIFKKLPKLTNLDLSHNDIISGDVLKEIPKLTSLDITKNERILDQHVKDLVNLTSLTISPSFFQQHMSDISLVNLTNLEYLDIVYNRLITKISHLKKLKTLKIDPWSKITWYKILTHSSLNEVILDDEIYSAYDIRLYYIMSRHDTSWVGYFLYGFEIGLYTLFTFIPIVKLIQYFILDELDNVISGVYYLYFMFGTFIAFECNTSHNYKFTACVFSVAAIINLLVYTYKDHILNMAKLKLHTSYYRNCGEEDIIFMTLKKSCDNLTPYNLDPINLYWTESCLIVLVLSFICTKIVDKLTQL